MNLTAKEDVITLIEEYQKHRVLWDTKDKWHFNKNKKQDAWEEIGTICSIDAEDAKRKMASLLGSFRRETAKGTKTVGTGKGAKDVYRSDWFAFKSFAFLMDKNEPRETISSEDTNDGLIEDNEVNQLGKSNESGETIEYSELENTAATFSACSDGIPEKNHKQEMTTTFVKPSTPKRKRGKLAEKEDLRIAKAFEILQEPTSKEDATSMYSKYLALKLEQSDFPTKATFIHKINGIIFDAEMEKYQMQKTANCPLSSPSSASTPPLAISPLSPYSQPSSEVHAEFDPSCSNFRSNNNNYAQSVISHSTSSPSTIEDELQEFINL